MSLILQQFKAMKWFFVSSIIVVLIALVLSVATTTLGHTSLYQFVQQHHYVWLMVRAGIIVGFILVWPYCVRYWAKRYKWHDEYAQGIKKRRWRFAVWLIVIDCIFQLL